MITTIILSKDRPAQLDLLLRSLERNGGRQFDPVVCREPAGHGFESAVRGWLDLAGEFVCFMCDDGILYRPLPIGFEACRNPFCIATSLRLGDNTTEFYPAGTSNIRPGSHLWPWKLQDWQVAGDFFYPGSIDGHVFRTADVRRMLAGKQFPNPTALECALVAGCDELAQERPLMACYPHSVYVGNPVNRVSEQSGVRFGSRYPVTAQECQERFRRGERIDLDALDFSHVDGAHTEIELKWR